MKAEIEDLGFPILIHKETTEGRTLSIKQAGGGGDMLFYIALDDGCNLVNFWANGDVTVNTDDYQGRDYKYTVAKGEHRGEVRFTLIPCAKK